MICKKCQIAGDMVAEARNWSRTSRFGVYYFFQNDPKEEPEFVDVPEIEAVRSVAHVFHSMCKGSTHCDCQHKIDFEWKVIKNGKKAGKPSGKNRKSSRKASRRDS